MTKEDLTQRADRFYNRYIDEVEQIAELLEIKLKQIALAYTIDNKLPREAIKITTRVKTKKSFLKKLEKKGWPYFYHPTEIAKDLIGARITCWFLDDCYAFMEFLKQSNHLKVIESESIKVKDYISNPQFAGYRAIHLFSSIVYDQVKNEDGIVKIVEGNMLCEIQIRTKLQDAWGDITHEFFYKAKDAGIENKHYEDLLSSLAENLEVQDKTFKKFRKAYQELIDEKMEDGTREGFST